MLVNDEFPEVIRAVQAARILSLLSKASSFTVFNALPRRGGGDPVYRVCCDGEWFSGDSLADALAQCGQWLEAREVQ
jgi:hypothetical protein